LIGESNSEGSSKKNNTSSFNLLYITMQIEKAITDELVCVAHNWV